MRFEWEGWGGRVRAETWECGLPACPCPCWREGAMENVADRPQAWESVGLLVCVSMYGRGLPMCVGTCERIVSMDIP